MTAREATKGRSVEDDEQNEDTAHDGIISPELSTVAIGGAGFAHPFFHVEHANARVKNHAN